MSRSSSMEAAAFHPRMTVCVRLGVRILLLGGLLAARDVRAASKADKCEAKKLRILGKYSACRMLQQAKVSLKGTDAGNFAKCDDTFHKALGLERRACGARLTSTAACPALTAPSAEPSLDWTKKKFTRRHGATERDDLLTAVRPLTNPITDEVAEGSGTLSKPRILRGSVPPCEVFLSDQG
jgi:hypothetical protein